MNFLKAFTLCDLTEEEIRSLRRQSMGFRQGETPPIRNR